MAPNASVIGEVVIGAESSVWFGTVLRGDINAISVGERTNLQDGVIVHVSHDAPVFIGSDVTVGHNAVLHGCRVEDGCLIGMHACLLDNVLIGESSLVAAGSVVPPGTVVPPGSLVMGSPAKVKRQLTEAERDELVVSAANYVQTTQDYLPIMPSIGSGVSE